MRSFKNAVRFLAFHIGLVNAMVFMARLRNRWNMFFSFEDFVLSGLFWLAVFQLVSWILFVWLFIWIL